MIAHLGLNVYDVTITEKPFGMAVNTSGTATVSVLPESPAAAMRVRIGDILLAINGTVVDAKSWNKVFNEATLPFVVRFRHSSGIHQCKLCGIARQFINIAKGPGMQVVESSSMNSFLQTAIDGYVLLLDSSGPSSASPPPSIFSFGAIPWRRGQRQSRNEHYCGVSLKNDPLHIGQHYDGHGGEALGLAITLATILPSIIYKGGTISAIVVDSINWAANMTTVPPSRLLKPILNLLAHELCAYRRVLIVERAAYGQFQGQHNWPPDVIASHKEITHEFAESAATCPTFEKAKNCCILFFFVRKTMEMMAVHLLGCLYNL